MISITSQQIRVLLVTILVVLATAPGLAVAQTAGEFRSGGTVVVGPGETVAGNLEATGGTVLIEGVVDGDLSVTAGTVVVAGTVSGDVLATAGSVTIEGTVGGDVGAVGGSVVLRQGAAVDGRFEAAAGDVRIDGAVGGDAVVATERLVVGETATVGGALQYDNDVGSVSVAPGATIAGGATAVASPAFTVLEGGLFSGGFDPVPAPVIPNWVGAVYGFFANLLLGVVLLALAPGFSRRVAGLGTGEALRSGGVGLLVLLGVPVLLIAVAVTIIGIPLSIAGFVAFLLTLWAAGVYGAYTVGTWLVSYTDTQNRWLALVVGLLIVALVGAVPILGGLIGFLVLLVGLGAFALALRGESGDGDRPAASAVEPGRPAA
jgi:cytoskeletal protein CcmA (bactofilin family)